MDFPIVLTDFENISLLPTDGLPSEVYDVLTYTSIPFVLLFFSDSAYARNSEGQSLTKLLAALCRRNDIDER
jgi:hypothetical protein